MLDGKSSHDPDGTVATYTWKRLPDGVVLYSGQDATFGTKALGRVEEFIELTVRDNRGGTATDTMKISNPKSEGPQGPPGITPAEVTAMKSQISSLQQQLNDVISKLPQLENKKPKN